MTDEKEWYYIYKGSQFGPITEAELPNLLSTDRLGAQSLVWKKGQGSWQKLEELFPRLFEMPPPIPGAWDVGTPPSSDEEPLSLSLPEKITKTEAPEWSEGMPHPWRRYLARMFDTIVNGSTLSFALVAVIAAIDPDVGAKFANWAADSGNQFVAGIMVTLLAALANALMLGTAGTTLGKLLFGIKVTNPDGSAVGAKMAMQRELMVYVRGLGLGIPIVALITSYNAYKSLLKDNITSWDKDLKLTVAYHKQTVLRGIVAAVSFVIVLMLYFALIAAGR